MDNKELQELIKNAKCPKDFDSNLIGPLIAFITDVNRFAESNYTFFPGDSNIDSLSKYDKQKIARFEVHSHGVWVNIGMENFLITNNRIISIDTIPYDEYVKVKKNMNDYILAGALLGGGIAGSLIGGAVGAILGIGEKEVHLKGSVLRVIFWDQNKQIKYLHLSYEGKKEDLESLVRIWEEQKKINIETGRKPEDVKEKGCFSMIALLIISSIALSIL